MTLPLKRPIQKVQYFLQIYSFTECYFYLQNSNNLDKIFQYKDLSNFFTNAYMRFLNVRKAENIWQSFKKRKKSSCFFSTDKIMFLLYPELLQQIFRVKMHTCGLNILRKIIFISQWGKIKSILKIWKNTFMKLCSLGIAMLLHKKQINIFIENIYCLRILLFFIFLIFIAEYHKSKISFQIALLFLLLLFISKYFFFLYRAI